MSRENLDYILSWSWSAQIPQMLIVPKAEAQKAKKSPRGRWEKQKQEAGLRRAVAEDNSLDAALATILSNLD